MLRHSSGSGSSVCRRTWLAGKLFLLSLSVFVCSWLVVAVFEGLEQNQCSALLESLFYFQKF